MPSLKEVLGNLEEYKEVLRKRGEMELLKEADKWADLHAEYLSLLRKSQKLRERRNLISRRRAPPNPQEIQEARRIRAEIEATEEKLSEIRKRISELELLLPNWLAPEVPEGGEEDFKILGYGGPRPKVQRAHVEAFQRENPVEFEVVEKAHHHYDLVGKLLDQDKAGEVAGARFYYEMGDLVLLDFALSLYGLHFFSQRGYLPMVTPYLLKKDVEKKIAHYSSFLEAIFEVQDDLVLLPTSEHSILAYYAGRIFEPGELPVRIVAWSPAFRREAGSHGKDTKGIFRVKQFHKVELHVICEDREREEMFEEILKDAAEFLSSLELPWRKELLASADMDVRALKQVDVAVWMPGQGRYRELQSIGDLGHWVSEKLRIRRRVGGGTELVANLYATGVAVQRTICALAENHWEERFRIPEVLQPWVKKAEVSLPPKLP